MGKEGCLWKERPSTEDRGPVGESGPRTPQPCKNCKTLWTWGQAPKKARRDRKTNSQERMGKNGGPTAHPHVGFPDANQVGFEKTQKLPSREVGKDVLGGLEKGSGPGQCVPHPKKLETQMGMKKHPF